MSNYHGGRSASAFDSGPTHKGWRTFYPVDPKRAMAEIYENWIQISDDTHSSLRMPEGSADTCFQRLVDTLRTRPLMCLFAQEVMGTADFQRLVNGLAMRRKP